MAFDIRKFFGGFKIISNNIASKSIEISIADNFPNNKEFTFSSTGADTGQEIVTTAATQVLTGKSIDADTNTLTNIENADIKTGAAIDAAKIHDGSVSNTEFGYLDGVTSPIQSQFGAKIESGSNLGAGSQVFKQVSGTDMQYRTLVAGTSIALTQDATTITIDGTPTTGANLTLSNLTSPTAINQNLQPGSHNTRSIGTSVLSFANIFGTILTAIKSDDSNSFGRLAYTTGSQGPFGTSGIEVIAAEQDLTVVTNNNSTADANATKALSIGTGNKTAGTGGSGNITVQTGTSSGGTRGDIALKSTNVLLTGPSSASVKTENSAGTTQTISLKTGNSSGAGSGGILIGSGTSAAGSATGGVNISSASGGLTSGDASLSTGDCTNASGSLNLTTGSSTSNDSGLIYMRTGATNDSGHVSGTTFIGTGIHNNGASGAMTLATGQTFGGFTSGQVNINSGDSSNNDSGNIRLATGTPSGAGKVHGGVYCISGSDGAADAGPIVLSGSYVKIPVRSGNPSSGLQAGAMYFNTGDNTLRVYNGSGWRTIATT